MSGAVAIHVPDSPIFSSPRLKSICAQSPSRKVLSLISSPKSSSPKSNSSPVKRKRPAMIDIPVFSSVWSLETPKVAMPEVMEVDSDCYSVYCKRGKRLHMEDRFSASVNFNGDTKKGFFGVYDGHGGKCAAEFAANYMEKNVMKEMLKRGEGDNDMEVAVKNGYLSTDKEFLEVESRNGGACCVTAMIDNGDLVVGNVGDCRAVICRGGVAEALSVDHQASRIDERNRIQALGGYVDCVHGVWRIQGSLAVTRGIGDRHLKQYVIPEPDTRVLKIENDCEFLILASDGLWDKVTNQEAVDLVRPLCTGIDKPEPFTACKKLVELAQRRCSFDDISVMIVQLGHFIS